MYQARQRRASPIAATMSEAGTVVRSACLPLRTFMPALNTYPEMFQLPKEPCDRTAGE